MRFENPGALWLLLVLTLLFLGLGLWGWRAKKETAETFHLNLRRLKRRQVEKHVAAGVLMALLVLALALPKLPFSTSRAPKAAGEIALLVDVSRSMAAQKDLGFPNRIERAKPILYQIVDRMEELGEVRVSLHGFTNRARSLVPFVGKGDYPYLKVTIEKVLDTFATPGEGSSLGRSLSAVADKFSPDENAKLQGVDYISYLEEDSLREIASRTGGRYFFEKDRDGLMEFIEENLTSASTEEVTAEVTDYRYIAHWFVLAALPIWVIFARNYLLR